MSEQESAGNSRQRPPSRSIGGGECRGADGHMRAANPRADRDGRRLRLEKLIGRAMREQRLERHRVELMSRTIASVNADDRSARERQITDRIERLVAHELVAVAQTFRVEDGVAFDGDRILERGAQRKTGLPQRLNILTNPKVRARAISRRKVAGSRSNTRRWRPIAGDLKSISMSRRNPLSAGRNSANPPS